MMTDENIKRINELYKKAKTDGLTEKEKIEQQELRTQYVASIRGSLRSTLDTVKVVDEEGNDVTPKKRKM